MRVIPGRKYKGRPCSYVATGCAYENMTGQKFTAAEPEGLTETGYATMQILNSYVRAHLPVKKKFYYPRTERFRLRDFLSDNTERAVVCVYGHLIYVNGGDYWSFFENINDKVVCIWLLK